MTKLIYLIGLPGSGKSTYADSLKAQYGDLEYVSSDSIREELYGDAAIQGVPQEVFTMVNSRTIEYLKQGKSVIYDATNLSRKKRINFLKNQIPQSIFSSVEKKCIVIWSSLDACIKRDSERDRIVGKDVILKMVKQFEIPWYDEGWDEISVLYNSDRPLSSRVLKELNIPHDNPHHVGTIADHTAKVINQVCELALASESVNEKDLEILKQVALYHDCGKPLTKQFFDREGKPTDIAHYYGHQHVSAYLYLGLATGAPDELDDLLTIAKIIDLHMYKFCKDVYKYEELKREYPELIRLVEIFAYCDSAGA